MIGLAASTAFLRPPHITVSRPLTAPAWPPLEELHPCDLQAVMKRGCAPGVTNASAHAAFYDPVDAADDRSCRPDFALLVYPAYLVDKNAGAARLKPDVVVTKDAPEMFFVHAADDGVTPQSSLLLAAALHQAGVPAELHLYPTGGHGYGLRHTAEPVTRWNERAAAWLAERGWLKSRTPPAQKP